MLARLHLPRGTPFYEDALEGLVRVNERLYRQNPNLPSVYSAGVRYKGLDPREDWQNAAEVIANRRADCEDLAAARAGELRARGEQGAKAIVRRTGPKMTHALVQRADGTIEDPSRTLGMGRRDAIGGTMSRYPGYDSMGAAPRRPVKRSAPQPKRVIDVGVVSRPTTFSSFKSPVVKPYTAPSDRPDPYTIPAPAVDNRPDPFERGAQELPDFDEQFYAADDGQSPEGDYEADSDWELDAEDWEQIGADPSPSSELSFVVHKLANGWQGVIKIPFVNGKALTVARSAPTKPAAAASAMNAVESVLNNPLAQALIPPQAAMALKVLQSPTAKKAAAVALKAAKSLKFW